MMKWKRSLAVLVSVSALLVALVAAAPNRTDAANLTGGQYTYLVNGDEVTFAFDPVVRKDGLLLPTEVFQHLGIKVAGAVSREVQLSKDEVAVKLTVGSTTVTVNAQYKAIGTPALRLNGRVFVPAELLREFGVEYTQDGNYVSMRTMTENMPVLKAFDDADWSSIKSSRWFATNVKSDAGLFVYSDWMLLNSEMINSKNLNLNYGTRARLNSLLPTNTLVWVKLTNTTNKAGGLVTATTYLVDDLRNQYEVAQVVDVGQGLLNGKVAPGADRTGVLVFPKVAAAASMVSVYYENNQSTLGQFHTIR